jgi:hypothetical protein
MTDPFDDPSVTWRPVDPRLTAVRRLEWAIPTVLVVVLLLVLRVGVGVPVWLVAAPLALYGWLWWLVGRQVGAWGYAERAEELLVRRGSHLASAGGHPVRAVAVRRCPGWPDRALFRVGQRATAHRLGAFRRADPRTAGRRSGPAA